MYLYYHRRYYMSVTWDQEAVQELRVPSLASEVFGILAILILLLLCATGLLGNLLVCVAIKFDRRLHNITNYFLFSLTLTDLLVCSLVMPISLVVEVHEGMWKWSFPMCLLYVYADVFLCTASIVHMSVISLDRYLGISKPLKARDKSKTSITVKIASVWIATMLISCPIAIMALIDSSNIFNHNICRITNRSYMIYGSTFAFLIPFLIMVVTYVRTTSLLKQQPVITSHQGVATNNRSEAFIPKRAGIQRNYVSQNPQNAISCRRNKDMTDRPMKVTLLPIYSKGEMELATRVLAIVFICFFICWTPFFGANLAFGFCGERCALPPTIASFFLWLGYFSSTINPLIYTIFNRQFRRTFLRILRCQCTHSIRSTNGGHCYSRRTHNDYWAINGRPDLQREHDRSNTLSYNRNFDEPKLSRKENSIQSIQPDNLPSTTNGKIDLLAQSTLNYQPQDTLKKIHFTWKNPRRTTITHSGNKIIGEIVFNI